MYIRHQYCVVGYLLLDNEWTTMNKVSNQFHSTRQFTPWFYTPTTTTEFQLNRMCAILLYSQTCVLQVHDPTTCTCKASLTSLMLSDARHIIFGANNRLSHCRLSFFGGHYFHFHVLFWALFFSFQILFQGNWKKNDGVLNKWFPAQLIGGNCSWRVLLTVGHK